MVGLIAIFIFVILMAVPGFYIITRKIFPKNSKHSAMWTTIILTGLLVAVLAWLTLANPPA
ncbi:MAG: hypothetical protein MJ053_05090 [Elusimicrobiaceae bacterium]|nr:hypothetical protein [Elusimicrobiaceae bacterium]